MRPLEASKQHFRWGGGGESPNISFKKKKIFLHGSFFGLISLRRLEVLFPKNKIVIRLSGTYEKLLRTLVNTENNREMIFNDDCVLYLYLLNVYNIKHTWIL